jgi:hypothetical protein
MIDIDCPCKVILFRCTNGHICGEKNTYELKKPYGIM